MSSQFNIYEIAKLQRMLNLCFSRSSGIYTDKTMTE